MPSDRPDPSEFLAQAQRMLRELFGDARGGDDGALGGGDALRRASPAGPAPSEQRENLTFALATRAVEALEDLALNVAAIRQRLERTSPRADGDGRDRSSDPRLRRSFGRSAAIVVSSPWPVSTTRAGGRVSSWSRIDARIVG